MKNKSTIATLLILAVLFYSCQTDYLSSTETFLINDTEFAIKLLSYKDGVIGLRDSLNLDPGEKKRVFEDKPGEKL